MILPDFIYIYIYTSFFFFLEFCIYKYHGELMWGFSELKYPHIYFFVIYLNWQVIFRLKGYCCTLFLCLYKWNTGFCFSKNEHSYKCVLSVRQIFCQHYLVIHNYIVDMSVIIGSMARFIPPEIFTGSIENCFFC